VHDRFHFGMGFVDFAMDVAFEIDGTSLRVDGVAVAVKFHDVSRRDKARRHAARQQKVFRVLVMAHADVAKTIDHALLIENTIGRDEIVDQTRIGSQRLRPGMDRGHYRPHSIGRTVLIDISVP
jgi:hypothetical protein